MKNIRILLVLVFVSLIPIVASAAETQATVFSFRGKVDILVPGGSWQPVQKGMLISQGTTISTGFNSTAVLHVAASTVTVQQLTRLKLEELLQQNGKLTTAFALPIGRIQAQVRSADGAPQNFQIHSPVATAAVRGTEFTFNGNTLIVSEGVVAFFNRLGQMAFVQHGQQSSTTGTNDPIDPESQLGTGTNLPSNGAGAPGGTGGVSATGTVVVQWQ